jgi:hypothetical protein
VIVHVFDHAIAVDAKPLADDLHVDLAVADVPGEAHQFVGIGGVISTSGSSRPTTFMTVPSSSSNIA